MEFSPWPRLIPDPTRNDAPRGEEIESGDGYGQCRQNPSRKVPSWGRSLTCLGGVSVSSWRRKRSSSVCEVGFLCLGEMGGGVVAARALGRSLGGSCSAWPGRWGRALSGVGERVEARAGRASSIDDDDLQPGLWRTLREFRRHAPIEEASTPPSAWYTDAAFADFETERVFGRGWQAVGHVGQVEKPGSFFTGRLGKTRYVVCKDEDGQIRAFHNVCRHHAAAVAAGSGCTHSFVCPYHGWTYGLDGRLQKANRLAGIRNFSARENGLIPIRAATWGPFVLISLAESKAAEGSSSAEEGWLDSAGPVLASAGINSSLHHVATREYVINCNWKVYCDNYLDGGYHVPHAHTSLAACLDLPSYSTNLLERVSIQSCRAAKGDDESNSTLRVGNVANYAFVYPNFMINRYGPWMDTNLVLPISPSECRVVFDWFLDSSLVHDKDFVERSIADSEVVQKEDIILCEDVQNGLLSPAYDVGRYAPRVEQAMHHFHCLLHDDLSL